MNGFQAPNPSLFFSRGDASDQRLGDLCQAIAGAQSLRELAQNLPQESSVVIAGYPDDEGICINGGRKGAKDGPDTIRKFLYRMTPSLHHHNQPGLYDIGNLHITESLEKRHDSAKQFAKEVLSLGHRWLALGGGHDYGYPDAAAFCMAFANKNPLVINFDAHLDVRPTDRGLTSGTPFYRLLSEFPGVNFLEVGIQSQCNSQTHLQWLVNHGGRVVYLDELMASKGEMMPVLAAAGDWLTLKRPTFLSIDMDAFDSAYAPGCSQSWPVGLHPSLFMRLFGELLTRLDVRGVGLYETSPPLDVDDHTSKLAALIIHRWLYHA